MPSGNNTSFISNITTDTGLFKDDRVVKLIDTSSGVIKPDLGDGDDKALTDTLLNARSTSNNIAGASIEGFLVTFDNETYAARTGSNIGNDTRPIEGQDIRSRIPAEGIRIGNVGRLEDLVEHDGTYAKVKNTARIGNTPVTSVEVGTDRSTTHLNTDGLNPESAIGRAVMQTVIWSDNSVARTSGVEASANSAIEEGSSSWKVKAVIPYTYDPEDKALALTSQMGSDNLDWGGYMRLSIHEMNSDGTLGNNKGDSPYATGGGTNYSEKNTVLNLTGLGLVEGTMYYLTIKAMSYAGKILLLNPVIKTSGITDYWQPADQNSSS